MTCYTIKQFRARDLAKRAEIEADKVPDDARFGPTEEQMAFCLAKVAEMKKEFARKKKD